MTTIPALGTSLTADTVVAADAPYFWIVELALDDSRRIEFRTPRNGPTWIRDKDVYLERYHNMVVWGPTSGDGALVGHEIVVGEYLPYPPTDGISIPSSEEPVNQIPQSTAYKDQVATFAHQYDILHDAKSIQTLTTAKQKALDKFARSMAGEAWSRLQLWDTIDPQALNPQGLLSWKTYIPYVEKAVIPCDTLCQNPTWVRQFKHANETLFNARFAIGEIVTPDTSVTPWTPGDAISRLNPASVTADNVANFFIARYSNNTRALDWYDSRNLSATHSHD